jgi:hypothetical protein
METTVTKEPTRDPRLLFDAEELCWMKETAERREWLKEEANIQIVNLVDQIDALKAKLAAQDQRHAALCGLVTDVRAILDMWHQKGNQHECVVAWMEGLARRIKEIQAALAPGDESREAGH